MTPGLLRYRSNCMPSKPSYNPSSSLSSFLSSTTLSSSSPPPSPDFASSHRRVSAPFLKWFSLLLSDSHRVALSGQCRTLTVVVFYSNSHSGCLIGFVLSRRSFWYWWRRRCPTDSIRQGVPFQRACRVGCCICQQRARLGDAPLVSASTADVR